MAKTLHGGNRPRGTVVSVFGLNPQRIGSAEAFARELSRQLADANWHSVLCFSKPPPDVVRRYLDLPNVSLETIENAWQSDRSTNVRLHGILKKYRPRILHLHYTGFISSFPWMAEMSGVEKVYFTDQTSPPENFQAALAPLWKRMAARCVSYPIAGLVSVSKFVHRTSMTRGLLPPEKLHLIYNGVDIRAAQQGLKERDRFRQRFCISADSLVVTHVGQLIEEKGIADFIAAAEIIAQAEPLAHFVMAGSGRDTETFRRRASETAISSRFTFTGMVMNPLLDGLFAAADVVCVLSRHEEAFGYVIAEAMASGKPVIGTRVGGIPELIDDGRTGFLVDKRSPDTVAEKVLALMRDPELRRRMGQAGALAVREKFDHKVKCREFLGLYGIESPARELRTPAADRLASRKDADRKAEPVAPLSL